MADVKAAVRRRDAAQKRLEAAQRHLVETLRVANQTEGVKQVDLVNATGYTREHVRRLLLPEPNE